jgi:hypothetical protein
MWWRVFGLNDTVPDLATLLEYLHGQGLPVAAHFRGDDLGWTGGELALADGAAGVQVERYLTAEDDLRDELNTWAAWLETQDHEPGHRALMQHVIGTRQLVTLRPPPEAAALDRLCAEVCRHLARQTDGVFQADGRGFFAADGTTLLCEDRPPRP